MGKAKVYLETTIPSYLAARPSRDLLTAAHQQLSRDWWDFRRHFFDLYVSEPVLREAAAGDLVLASSRLALLEKIPVLPLTAAILEIAQELVNGRTIPQKASTDALHIAIATVYGCEYLLTWNCRHIANAELQQTARLVVRKQGFELPTICTPEELMGEQHERN